MGADCKSVGLRLHRFESCTCHQGSILLTCSKGRVAWMLRRRRPQDMHKRFRAEVEAEAWAYVSPRRMSGPTWNTTRDRNPAQCGETVLDSVVDLAGVRGRANCGRVSCLAATGKDAEDARARARRRGYPYRNVEGHQAAEHQFRDHQMPYLGSRHQTPDRGSRCRWRFRCAARRTFRRSSHLRHRSIDRSSVPATAIIMLGLHSRCGRWHLCSVRGVLSDLNCLSYNVFRTSANGR